MDIKSLILIAGGVMIVAVILHGIWIAWRARRENLPMEIARDLIPEDFDEEARFRHELPNGGARVLPQSDGLCDDMGVSSPPMLLNTAGGVSRSTTTARPAAARSGISTREVPQEAPKRESPRRAANHAGTSRVQSRQDIDEELFGNGDALITENRRQPTQAQQDSRPAVRTELKNGSPITTGTTTSGTTTSGTTTSGTTTSGTTGTTGGYARTNGSHASNPAPLRVEPQTTEPEGTTARTEAPALRPRVQNVTVPANAQPVQRRALKERLATPPPTPEAASSEEEIDRDTVISIFLMARPGRAFSGHALYKALRAHGIKYGDMNIFHRVDPVSRVNLYSVANAVNPGTFDYSRLSELQTPGVVFFMQLEGLDHPLRIFDDMRRVASGLSASLDGELKDEHRSVIGTQTLDHYRERIAEYSRRRLSRRA